MADTCGLVYLQLAELVIRMGQPSASQSLLGCEQTWEGPTSEVNVLSPDARHQNTPKKICCPQIWPRVSVDWFFQFYLVGPRDWGDLGSASLLSFWPCFSHLIVEGRAPDGWSPECGLCAAFIRIRRGTCSKSWFLDSTQPRRTGISGDGIHLFTF